MSEKSAKKGVHAVVSKRLFVAIGAIALLSAGVLWFGGLPGQGASGEPGPREAETEARAVETFSIGEELLEESLQLTGEFYAYEHARLSFKIPGYVQALYFQPGDWVEQGQTLAKLDETDFALALQRAEAELGQARARLGLAAGDTREPDPSAMSAVTRARAEREEAERRVRRIRELHERQSASQSELDAAETADRVALHTYQEARENALERIAALALREAELEQARQNLENTALTAPFDGMIHEKLTGPGVFLEEGDPVYSLVQTDTLRLRVEVPERDVHKVSPGQTLRFRLPGDSETHTTTLTRLLPQLEADTRVLIGEADIENAGIWRPGLFVRAELVVAEEVPSITVPTSAITSFVGIHRVFVVEDGVAAAREVELGRTIAERTTIVDGLAANEEVIIDPREIRAGDPVHAASGT